MPRFASFYVPLFALAVLPAGSVAAQEIGPLVELPRAAGQN